LECLQWARQNGCDWISDTCSAAAWNGHLKCLQWARQNGCDWGRNFSLAIANERGHSHVVEWINSTA
jgi:hypothetical protein